MTTPRKRKPRQTTKPKALRATPPANAHIIRAKGIEAIRRKLHRAALAADMWVSGDGRIKGKDVEPLTGINLGTLGNHRGDPEWPQPFSTSPQTFALVDLAAFLWDRRPTVDSSTEADANPHKGTDGHGPPSP